MFYTQNLWCVAAAALLYNSHHNPTPYQSIFILKRCKFQVGSYSYDDTKMIFLESGRVKGYVETSRSIVLDYDVKINPLSPKVTYMIIQIRRTYTKNDINSNVSSFQKSYSFVHYRIGYLATDLWETILSQGLRWYFIDTFRITLSPTIYHQVWWLIT